MSQDLKTLRLASVQLTEALLEQFLRYQRAMLLELASAPGEWAGRLAFAHARALSTSELDVLMLHRVKALVSDFCGRRSAALRVRERVDGATPTDAKAQRAAHELPRLQDLSAFEARYGAVALELLRLHEVELLQLHEDLVRVEGSGGHLHPVDRS